MKFKEIYEQFSMVSKSNKDAMENPLVNVFTTVIIELSRSGLGLEERMQKLESENAALQAQIKELSNHKREHHE